MPENIESKQQSLKHLAARAVMAYRAGFPVALLSVTSSSERPSDVVCDWKSQRDSLRNDAKLLFRRCTPGRVESTSMMEFCHRINPVSRVAWRM